MIEQNVITDERIRKEVKVGAATLNEEKGLYVSDYQKDKTVTAEIKQTVETKSFYPSKTVSNDHQDNIYGVEDFGFPEQDFTNVETRVAWLPVPAGSTVEGVKAMLAKFPDARLYRVLSNRPILTDDQKYAIDNNVTTLDIIAARQAVRYSEKDDNVARRGQLVLDVNAKIQYRAVFFAKNGKEDADLRTKEIEDFYVAPSMKAELESVAATTI